MLRRLFGLKPKTPTLPLEYRTQPSAIPDRPDSASTLSSDGFAAQEVMGVRDVVDANFDATVLHSNCLAVVDFWAEWCQPCTIISAYTEWLARDFGAQLLVAALDVDENPTIPERCNILGLPTLIFFHGGVEVERQVGLLSYEELHAKVETLLAKHQRVMPGLNSSDHTE